MEELFGVGVQVGGGDGRGRRDGSTAPLRHERLRDLCETVRGQSFAVSLGIIRLRFPARSLGDGEIQHAQEGVGVRCGYRGG